MLHCTFTYNILQFIITLYFLLLDYVTVYDMKICSIILPHSIPDIIFYCTKVYHIRLSSSDVILYFSYILPFHIMSCFMEIHAFTVKCVII